MERRQPSEDEAEVFETHLLVEQEVDEPVDRERQDYCRVALPVEDGQPQERADHMAGTPTNFVKDHHGSHGITP